MAGALAGLARGPARGPAGFGAQDAGRRAGTCGPTLLERSPGPIHSIPPVCTWRSSLAAGTHGSPRRLVQVLLVDQITGAPGRARSGGAPPPAGGSDNIPWRRRTRGCGSSGRTGSRSGFLAHRRRRGRLRETRPGNNAGAWFPWPTVLRRSDMPDHQPDQRGQSDQNIQQGTVGVKGGHRPAEQSWPQG